MIKENELPVGWVKTNIENFCIIIMGQSPPSSAYNANKVGLPFFQGKTDFTDMYPTIRKWCTEPTKIADKNDILLSVRAPVGPTNLAPAQCCIGRGLAAIRPEANTKVLYILYAMRALVSILQEQATGTTFEAISGDIIRNFEIPLAPLAEQKRIVEAIEQHFSRLDAGIASLKQAQKKLKLYRASILKAAVEGELTAEWRTNHPTIEPASQLLERILQARRAKWEEEQRVKGKNLQNVKYDEPTKPGISTLPELPAKWCWARAEQLCDFITKGTTPTAGKLYSETGEIPFLKVYNLTHYGSLDFSIKPTFILRETHLQELSRSKVFPEDVLMNIVGPPLGKVSVVPNTYSEWNINQAIAIFRTITGYNNSFLCLSLLTNHILSWAVKRAKTTAGQHNLTLEICRNLPLPLPPLAEQERIVSIVEEQLSIISQLESDVQRGLKRAERMRQSILHRAFTGQLVAQDPNDEPASVLLERIRQGREGAQAGRTRQTVHRVEPGGGQARAGRVVRRGPRVPEGQARPIDVESIVQADLWQSVETEI